MREQRQYVRVTTPVMVAFPHPGTMKTEHSFSSDVSAAGMRFPTPVKFEIGQEVALTLELPFHNTPLQALGEVIWIRELARLGAVQYEVGVRFKWIEDPDRQRLSRHLQSLVPGRA